MAKSQVRQLDLFSNEETNTEPLFEVTWSHSKRSTLEQCPRRYYYQYFGGNKRSANDEPAKETIRFLKEVENRHLRAGSILHLVISTYFNKAQKGDVWNVDQLTRWACTLFRKDRDHSRAFPDGKVVLGEKFPPILLREYHYRLPTADELYLRAEERLVAAIEKFYHEPKLTVFREAGALPDSIVEKRFSLETRACKVDGRVDLAYRNGDEVIIVDWKLGAEDDVGSDSLQLATYGLWAIEHFDCAPDALNVYKVHLSSGQITPFRADAELLANATARIAQDAERMSVLKTYGERAVAEVFTPRLQRGICRECPFERVCYD